MQIIGPTFILVVVGALILVLVAFLIRPMFGDRWMFRGRWMPAKWIQSVPAKPPQHLKGEARYEWYIRRSILEQQQVPGITEIQELQRIQWMFFNRATYPSLKETIANAGSIATLRQIPKETQESYEDIEIITFRDQNGQLYAATIYDSWELWQDPEVLDIFPLLQTV